MKRIVHFAFIFMISSSGSVGFSARSCYQAHHLTPAEIWKKKSNELIRQNLLDLSTSGENDLYFYWHIANPPKLRMINDTQAFVLRSGRPIAIYQNNSDFTSEVPLKGLNASLTGPDISNIELVEAFIQNFKHRGSPEIIAAIRELEGLVSALANSRQGFGYVATAPAAAGGEIQGTFRVFNGSPMHSHAPAELPMEYLFEKYGIETETSKRLKKLREVPNSLIFEIGKFSVDGPPAIAERVRNLLELFLMRYYLDTYSPDANYFVHCTSLAHLRRYEQRYGLTLIETVQVPGSDKQEYVLYGTGKQIRDALSKVHPIPPRGIEIKSAPIVVQ